MGESIVPNCLGSFCIDIDFTFFNPPSFIPIMHLFCGSALSSVSVAGTSCKKCCPTEASETRSLGKSSDPELDGLGGPCNVKSACCC